MEFQKIVFGIIIVSFLVMIICYWNGFFSGSIPPEICPSVFNVTDTNINGTNYGRFDNTTDTSCQKLCLNDNNCDGWNFVNNVPNSPDPNIINSCWLKKAPFQLVNRYGVSGGTIKRC
jgi:hypothetical protein